MLTPLTTKSFQIWLIEEDNPKDILESSLQALLNFYDVSQHTVSLKVMDPFLCFGNTLKANLDSKEYMYYIYIYTYIHISVI